MKSGHTHTVQLIDASRRGEALDYLAKDPVQSAYLLSLLLENGPVHPANRGSFYAARRAEGPVAGLALAGGMYMFVADDAEAVDALALHARHLPVPRLVRGERERVERFWQTYAGGRPLTHTLSGERLLVRRRGGLDPAADEASGAVWAGAPGAAPAGLRRASLDDLALLVEVNVRLFCEEGGGNPLARDPQGFRQRLARRIERGHVWVWREGDRLVFKTDVIAETPQAVYIEGVYVAPEARGRGLGLRCLRRVSRELLRVSESVCLTANESNGAALSLYEKAGFTLHCPHTTIYLQQAAAA